MEDPEGTEGEREGCTGWFEVEAIIEKQTGDNISEDEDENAYDSGTDLIDFIDDSNINNEQAEHEAARALFNAQEGEDDLHAVSAVKRKFTSSPESAGQDGVDKHGSPRAKHICVNTECVLPKRKPCHVEDSGYGNSEVEAQQMADQVDGQNGDWQSNSSQSSGVGASNSDVSCTSIEDNEENSNRTLKSIQNIMCENSIKTTVLFKFKETYGVSFMELVRPFKSNRSSCTDWCIIGMGVTPSVAEGLKVLIQPYSIYAHLQCLTCDRGVLILLLIRFKCGKNRLTVSKLMSQLLNIPETHMVIEPPKLRSATCALYWYRTGLSNISEVYGTTPEWIEQQTVLQHSFDNSIFDFGEMVQWAYDHDITDDSDIAYKYAQLADVNSNAAAFLKSNSQAKIVKDCATMCRHYKRAERKHMNIGQWIQYRCDKIDDGGDWRPIVRFLRYQDIEFTAFLDAFKKFLKGIPKKNCLVLYGPANTGKSYFGMSLIRFLSGCVISYVNSKSHFWLQPLTDAKVGMIDDVTPICWTYIDDYMRNALDGNDISVDVKHRALVQIKCPPLILTTNTNAGTDPRWPYLHSRLVVFHFKNPFPFDENGNPIYEINNENWKSFFSRTWCKLDLIQEEDKENDGVDTGTFKCSAGKNTRSIRS
uniref:Replication protein E1 n=1 Tax=Human papillomavirus 52 TaxID=10618 RepID=A0A224AQQ7_HPV52|nr:E1 protein [human papillomavirus 52]